MPYYNEEDKDINKLKRNMILLVETSRQEMDVELLVKDYRRLCGYIPLEHYGYTSPYKFVREQLGDCFIFGDPSYNPKIRLRNVSPKPQEIQTDKSTQHYRNSKFTPSRPQQASNTPSTSRENTNGTKAKKYLKKKGKRNEISKRNEAGVPSIRPQSPLQAREEPESDWDDSGDEGKNAPEKKFVTVGPDGQEVVDYVAFKRFMWKMNKALEWKRWKEEAPLREVRDLVLDTPKGIWCSELLELYRERYGRELDYSHFRCLISLVNLVPRIRATYYSDRGDTLLIDEKRRDSYKPTLDAQDAVFPMDSMQLEGKIWNCATVAEWAVGDKMEVVVTEVYSPSILWLQRTDIGNAFEKLEREMNWYYQNEDRDLRRLHPGAVQVGHYCASSHGAQWRRSLIVKLLGDDEDFQTRTVVVLHVDYGTVKRYPARWLRPLRREMGRLDAQAIRARLAGVRPPLCGRIWPHRTADHFEKLVNGRCASATVTADDPYDLSLEVQLVLKGEKVSVSDQLLNSGHAHARTEPVLGMGEQYLYPKFSVLEAGATPNLQDLREYMCNDIDPYCVDGYRNHMPPRFPRAPRALVSAPPPKPKPEPPRAAATAVHSSPSASRRRGSLEPIPEAQAATAPPVAEHVTNPAENVTSTTINVTLTNIEFRRFILLMSLTPPAANRYILDLIRRSNE